MEMPCFFPILGKSITRALFLFCIQSILSKTGERRSQNSKLKSFFSNVRWLFLISFVLLQHTADTMGACKRTKSKIKEKRFIAHPLNERFFFSLPASKANVKRGKQAMELDHGENALKR